MPSSEPDATTSPSGEMRSVCTGPKCPRHSSTESVEPVVSRDSHHQSVRTGNIKGGQAAEADHAVAAAPSRKGIARVQGCCIGAAGH